MAQDGIAVHGSWLASGDGVSDGELRLHRLPELTADVTAQVVPFPLDDVFLVVRSKYSCGFPLERCKLLTRWAFEYFDQTGLHHRYEWREAA